MVVDDRVFLKWVLGLDYSFGSHVYTNVMWVHGFPDEFGAGDFLRSGDQLLTASSLFEDGLACTLADEECIVEVLKPRLGDYLVLGVDLRFLDNRLLVRLFGIAGLNGVIIDQWNADLGRRVRTRRGPTTREGYALIAYPEINLNVGHGFDAGVGALIQMGPRYSKFGQPAAGGSLAWSRLRYRY